MLGLIKQLFIWLLANIVNASNHTKYIALTNQQCMIQPALLNLHPDKYGQGLCY